jgi:hypothetical protein
MAAGPRLLAADPSAAPLIRLIVDPGSDAPGPLTGATVREGTGSPIALSEGATPRWRVTVVLDCGPQARDRGSEMAAALEGLADELPVGTRFGVTYAGEYVRALPPADVPSRPHTAPYDRPDAPRARLRDGVFYSALLFRDDPGARALVVLYAGEDGGSDCPSDVLRTLASAWGLPVFALSLGSGGDLSLPAAARASGGDAATARTADEAALIARGWGRSLASARTLEYRTDAPASGGWLAGVVRLGGEGAPNVPLGLMVPPAAASAVEWTPTVEAPLEAMIPVVAYAAGTRNPAAWTIVGRGVRVASRHYRVLVGTRPALERSVAVTSGGATPPLVALGGLRLELPAGIEAGRPLEIIAELTGRAVDAGWTGGVVPVRPGAYRVRLARGPAFERSHIGVVAGQVASIDLAQWAQVTVGLAGPGGAAVSVPVDFAPAGRDGVPFRGLSCEPRLLPPGRWSVSVATQPPLVAQAELRPGGESVVNLPRLGAVQVLLKGSGGEPARETWRAHVVGGGEAGLVVGVTNTPTLTPAAELEVELPAWPGRTFRVTVAEGETVEHGLGSMASLTVGILGADGTPRRLKYALRDSASGLPVVSGVTGVPIDVLPGTYDLDLWSSPHFVITGVEVPELRATTLDLGALGGVRVRSRTPARIGLYLLSEGAPQPAAVVETGETVEVRPGHYEARLLEAPGAVFSAKIDVSPGETAEVTVPEPPR